MNDPFEIPVHYKGEELFFPAVLQQSGYVHRFAVVVYGQEIFFEQDEEQNYRAMIDPEQLERNKKVDTDLLKAISEALEAILK